jgi:gamma-glutamylcyclotransferase (GGCT)/AIG2-like uncharacterized protein YtfP
MHLEPARCLLFVYGSLQPGQRPPESMGESWPDRVRGLLYDLGPYPAAVRIGRAEQEFQGWVLDIGKCGFTSMPQSCPKKCTGRWRSGRSEPIV